MKARTIKRKNITVDGVLYIYSVIEYNTDIQIRVYVNEIKIPILHIHFSYPEAYGIDVFRPKTTELLIRYFNSHYGIKNKTIELWLFQEKELFDLYVAYYFSDNEKAKKEAFIKHIATQKTNFK